MESFVDKLRDFIVEDLSWDGDPEILTAQYPLILNGVVDSLGIFQIVTMLEDDYDLQIEDAELVAENFQTLGAMNDLIQSKVAAA
jgi:acyl carrier protein